MTLDLDVEAFLEELVRVAKRRPELVAEGASALRAALVRSAPAERLFMRPTEAAQRYGVSRRTLFAWLGEGMPSCGSGRTRRVPTTEADEWVRERESTDDAIEKRARADAARAASRVVQ